jgi:hypothetical protein
VSDICDPLRSNEVNFGVLMKTFLTILLISLLLSQCGGAKQAQKETAASSDAATNAIHKDWKTVNVPIADLTLSLPPELSKESSSSDPIKNGDVTWTNHYYTWAKPNDNSDSPPYEAEVSLTNWDKDFPPEARGLSPEAMLALDYSGDERQKNNGTAPIEELSYLEIDGVKGEFFRAGEGEDKNRIWLHWHTFRYHKDKAQRLVIRVAGERNNLAKLTEIIHSARLARK